MKEDTMRTGIYVQKPTTVTIRASSPADACVQLRQFRLAPSETDLRTQPGEPVAVGTHQLGAGIYLIVSSSPMHIQGDHLTTQIVANDKDPWPELGAPVVGLALNATMAAVQEFFAVTKGIEVGDDPDADKLADDPDGL
jgi:hypothetical protein